MKVMARRSRFWLSILMSPAAMCPARADQVRVGGENHVRARVLGVFEGKLRFQADDRSVRDVWIDEVAFLQFDREGAFLDFNEGERLLAERGFDAAAQRFRRVTRATGDFWSELANARMAIAADGARQIDVVVDAVVRMANREMLGPPAAARLLPTNLPTEKGARSAKAISAIDTALTSVSGEPERVLLLAMRYDILRATADPDAPAAAARLVRAIVPEQVATDRVFASVFEALRATLAEGADDATRASLDRALSMCPEQATPGFLFLKGRVLAREASTSEEKLRATWPFLRIVAHFPADAAVPEALLEAATLLRGAGQRQGAETLATECLAHVATASSTRQKAEALLNELRR